MGQAALTNTRQAPAKLNRPSAAKVIFSGILSAGQAWKSTLGCQSQTGPGSFGWVRFAGGVLGGKIGIVSAAPALRSFAHWREQTANDSIDGSEMGLHLNEGWGRVVRTCLSKRKYIK